MSRQAVQSSVRVRGRRECGRDVAQPRPRHRAGGDRAERRDVRGPAPAGESGVLHVAQAHFAFRERQPGRVRVRLVGEYERGGLAAEGVPRGGDVRQVRPERFLDGLHLGRKLVVVVRGDRVPDARPMPCGAAAVPEKPRPPGQTFSVLPSMLQTRMTSSWICTALNAAYCVPSVTGIATASAVIAVGQRGARRPAWRSAGPATLPWPPGIWARVLAERGERPPGERRAARAY